MPDFRLSAQLCGHESDARAVCFPDPDTILSASRDKTVRVWRRTSTSPPAFDSSISTQGHAFITSLAYLPPSQEYPAGLVVSGGQDTLIDVRKPTSSPDDNAERLLVGHGHNVCALDVSPNGKWVVSGGWDGQCRVWPVGKWETELMLNHDSQKSVWAVLAVSEHIVITGSADENVRIFDLRRSNGGEVEPLATLATPQVVRALCKLPTGVKGHPSGADFASASNDGVIRLWKLNGQQVGELHGHESFIYSLASLPTGEIVSSGEDRTVRVWKGSECIQTITHPAISVWSVAVCPASGDIVSGSSDSIVRVFSRNPERMAAEDLLAHFNESVRASAIPQQQLSSQINRESLDGPDWLNTYSGNKDGQVKMIREGDGSISAHQWSMSEQKWTAVGTVVDSAASGSSKVQHEGAEYDFVFDVDIEDGKPPLKLPYNVSENPYEAATKFLTHNELPISYLESVSKFIVENTKGVTIGAQSQPPHAGGVSQAFESQPERKRYLPHEDFITLTGANFAGIQKKLLSVNESLTKAGNKEFALNPSEISVLVDLITTLSSAAPNKPLEIADAAVSVVIKLAAKWAYPDRLPGLDLLRCMAPTPSVASLTVPTSGSIIQTVLSASLEPNPATFPVNENSVMMAFRTITNLFTTREGRAVAASEAETVMSAMQRVVGLQDGSTPIGKANRNLQIAVASTAFNYACLGYLDRNPGFCEKSVPSDVLLQLYSVLGKTLASQADEEVTYRILMALGMLLSIGGEVREAGGLLGAREWVREAVKRAEAGRVKDVGRECLALLG